MHQRQTAYYSFSIDVFVTECYVFASKQPLLICFLLLQEITTLLPFSGISLDILPDSSDLGADLSDYIHHRVNGSTQVAANVTTPTGTAPDQLLLSKFSSHLSTRSHGSILYLQLTLDLFHKGHLALKGGNYLVVPVSLSEVRHCRELSHNLSRLFIPQGYQFAILPLAPFPLTKKHSSGNCLWAIFARVSLTTSRHMENT